MDAAAKGERYARLFRKVGTFIGKGNIARAIEVLKEGRNLAQSLGDSTMERRFGDEITRLSQHKPHGGRSTK
ncbi:MAG TPA: hypothetical protein VKB84_14395 [Candidatus Binataceae bacterium]|jgi:hypothetical protein|nr:hypothetical protein [Candidatus Binataceae bacterium]